MRAALAVLGVLILWVGGVWFLQGIGRLPGSFMSGQTVWAWIGGATVLVGLAVIALALRPRRG